MLQKIQKIHVNINILKYMAFIKACVILPIALCLYENLPQASMQIELMENDFRNLTASV